MKKMKLVKIDHHYCDYLRRFDSRVSYNAGQKELRPFIGILFTINNVEYFAPLSSPKNKHSKIKNTLDIFKINEGKLGVINYNNMIPVNKSNYEVFDLNKQADSATEEKRLILMRKQMRFITANQKEILKNSLLLYKLYKQNNLPIRIKSRCCNFILLEEKCMEYNKSY